MILFIHGIHQSAGVFLPLIKAIIGDNHLFEDKLLLDSFCLWLPGYDKKDREFNYKYIEDEIYDFINQKRQIQTEIASKLLFSSIILPIQMIKESKVNIIGCDVGAGVALDFSAHNPDKVSSIVMIDCSSNFGNLRSKWTILNTNRLINQPAHIISQKYETETEIYKKIFLSNIATYPSAKGIFSYLNLFKSYNFGSTFDKISIDQQNILSQVKILNIVDKKYGLSDNFGTKKLQKILDKKFKTTTKRGIFIKSQSHKNFNIQSVSIGTKSILNHEVVDNICEKLKEFYNY